MVKDGSLWGEDGWAVQPGEGEIVDLGGPHRPEILVRGADVQHVLGAFIFHHDVITENPPHAHHDWMKIAYVLDGIYHFRVGDAEFSGGAGSRWSCPAARTTPSSPRPAADYCSSARPPGTRNFSSNSADWGQPRLRSRRPRWTSGSRRRPCLAMTAGRGTS